MVAPSHISVKKLLKDKGITHQQLAGELGVPHRQKRATASSNSKRILRKAQGS